MKESATIQFESQIQEESRNTLDAIFREGAQQMLAWALDAEIEAYIERNIGELDKRGKRMVVRNGFHAARTLLSALGPLKVRQPRVNDRRAGAKFSSSILPPYMRRSPSLNNLIPALYLKGVSTGQFEEALESILGPDSGISATTVTRLKERWTKDYEHWRKESLAEKEYVYWWADGIHFNVRLDDERSCVLVIIGTLADGTKELVGIVDGYRESKLSWIDLLRNIKERGLKNAPKLAVGDGALGFWAALREEFPGITEQRCWVHKTANVLDKMPKGVQGRAKELIHEMYMAETKIEALEAYERFLKIYQAKYPKACECLVKDKDVLFKFYDFPAQHWQHIRTTNPIESTFATVRHRTKRTKGCGSRMATLTMVFKLVKEAENHWRRLRGYKLIHKVIAGVKFVDGIEEKAA